MEHSEDNETKTQYFSTTEYSGGEMFGYNSPAPPKTEVLSKRPLILTIFCILGFIGVGTAPILAFTESAAMIGEWYPPFLLVSAAVYLAAYFGLWKMKGWSPILLLLMFLVNQGVLYAMNQWTPFSLISVIVVAVALSYMKKMD